MIDRRLPPDEEHRSEPEIIPPGRADGSEPESISAVRAAYRDVLQKSVNLALGSSLATIGLTIPASYLLRADEVIE